MRKVFPLLAACLLSAVTSIPAQAQTAVTCTYMLLRVYHAEMDACHVALPKDEEARYSTLRARMEKYIQANAKQDPKAIISGIETDNIPRALKGLKSCQSDDFTLARKAMDQMTSPADENALNGMMATPHDPNVGSCGN